MERQVSRWVDWKNLKDWKEAEEAGSEISREIANQLIVLCALQAQRQKNDCRV